MHTVCLPGAYGGQKQAQDPLELEVGTGVNHRVGEKIKPTSFTRALIHCYLPSPSSAGIYRCVLSLPYLSNRFETGKVENTAVLETGEILPHMLIWFNISNHKIKITYNSVTRNLLIKANKRVVICL